MDESDIIEFFKNSKNISLLDTSSVFPHEIGTITFIYANSYNLDWLTMSLWFQSNFKDTYNWLTVKENGNATVDINFKVTTENKQVEVTVTELKYNKDKFDLFMKTYKPGDHINMIFHCGHDVGAMMEASEIDPEGDANQPIHITCFTIIPSGA